jgi:hypothetical protein
MSESLAWESVQECYRRAQEARRIIGAVTTTPAERADFLQVERRWLSLAHEYEQELRKTLNTKSAA